MEKSLVQVYRYTQEHDPAAAVFLEMLTTRGQVLGPHIVAGIMQLLRLSYAAGREDQLTKDVVDGA